MQHQKSGLTAIITSLKKEFFRLAESCGWLQVALIPFYPLVALITNPVRLAQSLWACRLLTEGRWGHYNRFSPHNALNSLSYWTIAYNLSTYGRNGRSPTVGLGDFFLGNWWYVSLPSLYAYWRGGAVVPLIGMLGWWVNHFVWLDKAEISFTYVMTIIFLALISTTFYANTFTLQNYNALGWLFFPLGLYGWCNDSWSLATLAWWGASFASFTVVFLACLSSLVVSIHTYSFVPMLTVLPAGLKLLTHFRGCLSNKSLLQSLLFNLKSLGFIDIKAKYKYKLSLSFKHIYYLAIYSQFFLAYTIVIGTYSFLMLIVITVYLINARFYRFADEQSMYMFSFSIASALMLNSSFNHLGMLISYWLLISPLPLVSGFPEKNCVTMVPQYTPFRIKPILRDMENFLRPVPPGSRIFMAFEDPGDDYSKIFDGYRVIIEAPIYVAQYLGIHLFPDWNAVFELNYEGAPGCWGRDIDTVEQQLTTWQAKYVLLYQPAGTPLSQDWRAAGFKVVSYFSWNIYDELFGSAKPYRGDTPDWWLLEKESHYSQDNGGQG